MSELMRLSLSIERPLMEKLEKLIDKNNYANRSEFIRDLVRDRLVEEQWEMDADVVGTITMIFDHHARELQKKLTHAQHHHHEIVLATTHLHLNHDVCLEVIMTRGKASDVQHLYESLRKEKGVLHVTLSMTSSGVELA
jgi:CopG family nickel-responsive transcriptional regulator